MRKIFLLCLSMLVSLSMFAQVQSFKLTFEDKIVNEGDVITINHSDLGVDATFEPFIENISAAGGLSIEISFEKKTEEHSFTFCTIGTSGGCFLVTTDPWISKPFSIPGESGELAAHTSPNNTAGTDILVYTIKGDNNESLTFKVQWNIGTEGIEDFENLSISDIYPNPCQDKARIDYDLPAEVKSSKMVIYNLLGNVVLEREINDRQGQLQIQTSDMNPGVYFYSLVLNNKSVSTKKLIIK